MAIANVKATINGQTYTLTWNASSSKYEATINAPGTTSWPQPNNKYGVTVVATDTAGNSVTVDRAHSTLGANLQLRVLEKTPPTATIQAPSNSSFIVSNTPTFTIYLRDVGSGIDNARTVFKVDNVVVTGYTSASVSDGFNLTYTPTTALSDGQHTATVQCYDNDGNVSSTVTSTFTIDTVPPTLSLSSPTDKLITNANTVNIIGTTNDLTSSPVTVKVNGTTITVNADGTFNHVYTLANGNNVITVTATDRANRTTTITRNVVQDKTPPVITAVELVPNPVDCGATFIIKVTAND